MLNTNENTQPDWVSGDTRILYMYIISDPDLLLFTIREFGQYDNHFTDECEEGLKSFFGKMIDSLVITERVDLDRVSWSQIVARFLDGYHTQVTDYQTFNSKKLITSDYDGFDFDEQI